MRRLALHVAIALTTFLFGLCVSGLRTTSVNCRRAAGMPYSLSSGVADADAEAEVRELMRQYALAQTRHDASFFETAEADSYVVHLRWGGTMTKSQVIESMKGWDTATRYEHRDLRVQIVGDTAVVTGWMTATHNGSDLYSYSWKSVYLLKKSGGRWQILSVTQVN